MTFEVFFGPETFLATEQNVLIGVLALGVVIGFLNCLEPPLSHLQLNF